MALTPAEIQQHAMVVSHQAFFAYFAGRDLVPPKHPLTSQVFPEQATTRSQIGGLETSLGTGLWQRLAKRLAAANKVEVLEAGVVESPKESSETARLARELERHAIEGTALDEVSARIAAAVRLLPLHAGSWMRLKKGDGVDFHFRKNGTEYAVDIKTAHLNAKNGSTFHDMLKRWIVYRQLKAAGAVEFRARLVIPYDSRHDDSAGAQDWWEVNSGKAKPLARSDVWIGNEFWAELTDCSDAWNAIRRGFEDVAEPLRRRYEPLLSKTMSVSDLKNLLESYAVTNLEMDSNGSGLELVCACKARKAISPSRAAEVPEKPVKCGSRKRCGREVLAESGFRWTAP